MIDSSVVEIRHPLYTEKEGRGCTVIHFSSSMWEGLHGLPMFGYTAQTLTHCIDTLYAHDVNRRILRDFPE
jgi:hypothetical protein